MGYIYCIINNINNKKYIGQTSQYYPNNRWSAHKLEAKNENKRPLYRAIKKYGIDNFTFKILLKNIPNDKLNYYEILWIEKMKTRNPNGYNLQIGGSNVQEKNNPMYGKIPWNKGIKRTKDEIQKMKDSWTLERREKYSNNFKGEKNPMYGKCPSTKGKKLWDIKPNPFAGKEHTQETKDLLKSKSKKIPIMMVDLEDNELIKFESIKDACKWIRENTMFIKADDSFISKCAKGKHKTAYGYKWKFIEKV